MNTFLWAFLWMVFGWLTGILIYFAGGLFVLAQDDDELRTRVANYYSEIAMKILDAAALVERGTGFDIYQTQHDADKNADTFTIDGNTAHVSNETGLLSTLHKRDFGLVPPPDEDVAVYVSPELGELGQIEAERQERDELTSEDGQYVAAYTLPGERPFVRLREYARRMVPESRSLWDLDETVELYKQSQAFFGETTTVQLMILVVAYGVAALLTWLIATNGGGTVPSGVNIPLGVLPFLAWGDRRW